MIQLVVDEFRETRIPVHGVENDWYSYWLDWNNIYRIKVLDPETNVVKGYKWVRSGRDHLALSTIYWRIGISRFSSTGSIAMPPEEDAEKAPKSYMLDADGTVSFNPKEFFDERDKEDEGDWRVID